MRKYDELEMEVVLFATEDVIEESPTQSGTPSGSPTPNDTDIGEWLP